MKSAICRWSCSPNCCAFCKSRNLNAWAATVRSVSTCASWQPPTVIWPNLLPSRRFRSDLFYRLNVFPILLPPLRERREDVPLLVRYFVQNISRRQNKTVEYVPSDVMDALVNYSWPGNIRELENLIERAVLLSGGNEFRVPLAELKAASAVSATAAASYAYLNPGSPSPPGIPSSTPIATLEDAERQHILRALRQTKWRISGPRVRPRCWA